MNSTIVNLDLNYPQSFLIANPYFAETVLYIVMNSSWILEEQVISGKSQFINTKPKSEPNFTFNYF